jgi:site-specific recombinase XerD
VRGVEETKVCPRATLIIWLERIREHFGKNPTEITRLFWTNNWQEADQRVIKNRLDDLIHTLGVQGATANSIRHASTTELAVMGVDDRTLNTFTHHSLNSQTTQKFYVFAAKRQTDTIASALTQSHGVNRAKPDT